MLLMDVPELADRARELREYDGMAADRTRYNFKLRLFRKSRGNFGPYFVHEKVDIDGPVGQLQEFLLHYPKSGEKISRITTRSTCFATVRWLHGTTWRCGAGLRC